MEAANRRIDNILRHILASSAAGSTSRRCNGGSPLTVSVERCRGSISGEEVEGGKGRESEEAGVGSAFSRERFSDAEVSFEEACCGIVNESALASGVVESGGVRIGVLRSGSKENSDRTSRETGSQPEESQECPAGSGEVVSYEQGLHSPGFEGLRVGGLKEQGLRALSSPMFAMSAKIKRGPFLPLPGRASPSLSSVEGPSLPLDSCIFCRIVSGKDPAFKLYEDEFCICILDINPLAHGHSLVIPKVHYNCLQSTPPVIAAAMCAAVPVISAALMEATNCDSFNMVVNSGAAAGQVVHHTHYHIIPRFDGDGLWHSETAPRRPFMGGKEAAGFVRRVRSRLASR